MTGTEHALSQLLTDAARRVRNDGHFEVQAVLNGAPPRAIEVGPIAEILATAAGNFARYEGRGWGEAKILERVDGMDRAALAVARAIFEPKQR
jgi:hypothetical protein